MFSVQGGIERSHPLTAGERKYDLEERLIAFAVSVIETCERLPDTRAGNHVAGQLVRSGTSPASNYGEAQSAESRKDFVHKMKIALKELQETRVWLAIVQMKAFGDSHGKLDSVQSECQELIRIFAKSISTAKAGGKPRTPAGGAST